VFHSSWVAGFTQAQSAEDDPEFGQPRSSEFLPSIVARVEFQWRRFPTASQLGLAMMFTSSTVSCVAAGCFLIDAENPRSVHLLIALVLTKSPGVGKRGSV
jgi:hypothetical protein